MKSAAGRRAFSLIEVLVALVVLSVGIYSVAGLLSDSQQTAAGADTRLQGAALAQLKLEELKASPSLAEVAGTEPGRETLVPAGGAAKFEQNDRYAWRAALERNAERVDIRVDVTRSGGGASAPPVSASGFAMISGNAKKGEAR